jgi:hypothetical protein
MRFSAGRQPPIRSHCGGFKRQLTRVWPQSIPKAKANRRLGLGTIITGENEGGTTTPQNCFIIEGGEKVFGKARQILAVVVDRSQNMVAVQALSFGQQGSWEISIH